MRWEGREKEQNMTMEGVVCRYLSLIECSSILVNARNARFAKTDSRTPVLSCENGPLPHGQSPLTKNRRYSLLARL